MRKDTFQSPDYYGVDTLYTEEQLLVRNSVREWVKENVSPIIEDYALKGEFPKELLPKIAEIGGFGAIFPFEYGGSELDYIAYGLMMQELERGDSSVRVLCSIQTSLVMNTIFKYGTATQKEHYLPKLASGELIGSFGMSEPGHGSNPASMDTNFREEENCFLLNGSKMWIGNAPFCDIALVWAKGIEETYACFIVDRSMDGFSTAKIDRKWSFRASETGELLFQDAKIPKSALLHKGDSIKYALECLNLDRYSVACGMLGMAMECYDVALTYANERTQFGKQIASNQLIQNKLVDMLTEITKAQLLMWRLGSLMNEGTETYEQISMAKKNNAAIASDIARKSRQILGGMGITADYPIMRHLINLETLTTYQGTDEIHTLIIGRDITGVGAF